MSRNLKQRYIDHDVAVELAHMADLPEQELKEEIANGGVSYESILSIVTIELKRLRQRVEQLEKPKFRERV